MLWAAESKQDSGDSWFINQSPVLTCAFSHRVCSESPCTCPAELSSQPWGVEMRSRRSDFGQKGCWSVSETMTTGLEHKHKNNKKKGKENVLFVLLTSSNIVKTKIPTHKNTTQMVHVQGQSMRSLIVWRLSTEVSYKGSLFSHTHTVL